MVGRLFQSTAANSRLSADTVRAEHPVQRISAPPRPEIPLHTNGSENDIRCQVTRRKVSGGTRSDAGRDCRDAFLSLSKTCAKLKIAFWDYLGARLKVPNNPDIPYLPQLIRHRCATA
jgi:hypothetical protein